ncbi:proline dehydrogenase family protein [Croceimicrobium hydrocarbonivorans]|uniref:Proline dehydrogenase family protein n=1 Tax=Croceimicrobium hydrocarbonivorans TaxID=2761580 RepID=A0A7H0VHW9_9FLAO|nr:proline dehydrogenase family protein [Croceimicrobium hydrocarbonivorans]QNR25317.1 proline dehydrogenase family protein [Croceimicrobium hydrocarbonivorans]
MLDFNDTKTAFILKSDNQLRKAYWLFRLVANSSLVGLGRRASNLAIKLGLPIRTVVKQTVYDQFVGGETIEECQAIIDKLREHGVSALLDFAVEGKETEADFNATKDEIVETIQYAGGHPGIPFGVFKVTGIAPFDLLERHSAGLPFNEVEARAWERAKSRMEEICYTANKYGLRIMIDAEESWIQKAIDEMAREMMERFNRDRVVVINTLQMYRKDRLQFLKDSYHEAREKGYFYGAKLVRGAYMEKERDRAADKKYPDPIHATKADSDQSYDDGIRFLMEHLDTILVVAGSHNEESARLLAEKVNELKLDPKDDRVWFSQLYGMSDNLSFNLAKAGYNVVKYLPFGPVTETLPYLIRRAEENSSASGQSGRELSLIKKEMKRRGLD